MVLESLLFASLSEGETDVDIDEELLDQTYISSIAYVQTEIRKDNIDTNTIIYIKILSFLLKNITKPPKDKY